MVQLLKQSTQKVVRIGPFMDATNAVTPETGVTLGAADQAELLKDTGATVDISGATWSAITSVGGWYDLTLTTSHTDTLGHLAVIVQDESVCLPVFKEFMVVPANVYESLVAGNEFLEVTDLKPDISMSGTTITVKKTDGATTQFTRTASTNINAEPIVGLD
jgi:hypothetical protein